VVRGGLSSVVVGAAVVLYCDGERSVFGSVLGSRRGKGLRYGSDEVLVLVSHMK
jgi:hypothetical protein